MTVAFAPALPSAVKSIRQRDLLGCWLRQLRAPNVLPRHVDFRPERVSDELIDMMVFHVVRDAKDPRFLIVHEGLNLARAYGADPSVIDQPRFLDDAIGPERYAGVVANYQACVEHRRPIYTIAMVRDQDGKDVAYERLLLPFGNAGEVDQIVGSYKTISIEGGFKIKDIMNLSSPVSFVRSVIETFPVSQTPRIREPVDEIVEI
jgi:hypothetical protein